MLALQKLILRKFKMEKPLKKFWNFVLWANGLSEDFRVEYKKVKEKVKVVEREHHNYRTSGYGGSPFLSRILHQGGSKKNTFETTFDGSSGEITIEKKEIFNDYNIGDKAKICYDQAYLITSNFVYPNFSEKKEVKRERVYYADKIKNLTKLID